MEKNIEEELEKLGHYALYEGYDDLQVNETEEFNFIKQAIQHLKTIDNANPREALKGLKHIKKYYVPEPCTATTYNYLEIIEQSLLKTQEQEKENAELKRVLEVLFKKQVDLGWLWYCVHECINSLDEYNKKMPIEKFKLTQEEFDLLGKWSKCLSN